MDVSLSKDQQHAVDLSEEWWHSDDKLTTPFVLVGAAGTGKSTIINSILEKNGIPLSSVLMVATSATATDNIKEKNKEANAKTIAGFIKGKQEMLSIYDKQTNQAVENWLSVDDIGRSKIKGIDAKALHQNVAQNARSIETVRLPTVRTALADSNYYVNRVNSFRIDDTKIDNAQAMASLLIIDELGMVSDDEMEAMMNTGMPIIAAGDPYQLPPVQGHASSWLSNKSNKYYTELSEIHRQSEGSALLDVATTARLGGDWYNEARKAFSSGAHDIIIGPQYAKNPRALNSADVIIAITNKAVQRYNNILHHYRSPRQLLSPDEKIVITHNSTTKQANADLSMFINGQSGTVLKVYQEDELARYHLTLADIEINGVEYKRVFLNTYQFDNPKINPFAMKDMDSLGMDLYSQRRSSEFMENLASNYNAYTDEVIYATYGYAMTVHRAQGKEWNNVIFDGTIPAIMKKSEKEIVYTAITRAKNKLLLL